MIKTVTMYVHGSKDSNWELGEAIGLKGEALQMFRHACTEVELTVEVDIKTGKANIIKVDGHELSK